MRQRTKRDELSGLENWAWDEMEKIGYALSDLDKRNRCGIYGPSAGLLAVTVALGGNGDHLEIGTAFGGSAILAAKVKEKLNLDGKVVCVDAFGYPPGTKLDRPKEWLSTPEWTLENFKTLGVAERMELVAASSYPWPLGEREFASALLDGFHLNGAPILDYESVKNRVWSALMLHDYPKFEDVKAAGDRAKADGWKVVAERNNALVLRWVNDATS